MTYLNRWLEDRREDRAFGLGLFRTTTAISNYLSAQFSAISRLDQITPLDVQSAYETKIQESRFLTHAVIHSHRTLRSALRTGGEVGHPGAEPSTVGASVPAEPRREMCVLTARGGWAISRRVP